MAFVASIPLAQRVFHRASPTRTRTSRLHARTRRRWVGMTLKDEGRPPSRLFSNVELNEQGELKRAKASEASCAALIAGTMVGAGVLALPDVTASAGFGPSSAALIAVWSYMVGTALLLTEVSLSTVCSLGRPSGVSLLSLGRVTLGRTGGFITAITYTLLHYAILTAYTAQGGTVLRELFDLIAHLPPPSTDTPHVLQVVFALALGVALYALPEPAVEKTNNALVIGVGVTFFAVLASLATAFDPNALAVAHPGAVLRAVPVFFVSCVYHNVVGTVASRLEGDLTKIRRAVIGGSAVPLVMFLIYNAAVLGAGDTPPSSAAWAVDAFSLLAIVTSFVGFVAGLVDLWSDVRISLLGERADNVQTSLAVNYAATVVPPALFCILFRDVFLNALDVAGTYAITVLFGVLPAAMAWKARENVKGFPRALPGGKPLLLAMAAAPCTLIASKLAAFYSSTH